MRAVRADGVAPPSMEMDANLRARLASLYAEGRRISERFEATVRRQRWHPFVAADFARVETCLLRLRQPGLKFLEWGSGAGTITIMADMLGFEAYGIEIDVRLTATARVLARKHGSSARFARGSFLPAGYRWVSETGDTRLGTIGQDIPGYLELQHPLRAFDIVFGYPWSGEEPIMLDIMQRHGCDGAKLLLHGSHAIQVFQGGRPLD